MDKHLYRKRLGSLLEYCLLKVWIMLTHLELRRYWVKGLRNGNLYKLDKVERAFYKACMLYARRAKYIVNRFLLGLLQPIVEKLTATPKTQALQAGLETARRMYTYLVEKGVLAWAPYVRLWLTERSFIEYLGFMKLNTSIYLGV